MCCLGRSLMIRKRLLFLATSTLAFGLIFTGLFGYNLYRMHTEEGASGYFRNVLWSGVALGICYISSAALFARRCYLIRNFRQEDITGDSGVKYSSPEGQNAARIHELHKLITAPNQRDEKPKNFVQVTLLRPFEDFEPE